MPPLVSIITPSYNQAEYLEYTLRSVLLQDYPAIEYLVVDGGSSDGSRAVIERYANRLAWWISEPDKGQADAINKGLRKASGEIVAWLNSDDLYLPGAITSAVAALQARPQAGLVFGNALSIDEAGRPINLQTFGNWDFVDLLSFRIICQPAVFMRREIAEKAGFLDTAFHFMLDHLLWIHIGQLAPIWHRPDLLAAARQHREAKNVRQAAGFSHETQAILDWMPSQPGLDEVYRRNRRKIRGGAYRLQARYYLDADQPRLAAKYYAHALFSSPGYAFKHWRRMLYALAVCLSPKTASRLGKSERQALSRRKRQAARQAAAALGGWPGIALE